MPRLACRGESAAGCLFGYAAKRDEGMRGACSRGLEEYTCGVVARVWRTGIPAVGRGGDHDARRLSASGRGEAERVHPPGRRGAGAGCRMGLAPDQQGKAVQYGKSVQCGAGTGGVVHGRRDGEGRGRRHLRGGRDEGRAGDLGRKRVGAGGKGCGHVRPRGGDVPVHAGFARRGGAVGGEDVAPAPGSDPEVRDRRRPVAVASARRGADARTAGLLDVPESLA